MKKSNKLYVVLIIVLLIVLGVMTYLYFDMKNTIEDNLSEIQKITEENNELNKKVSELQKKSNIASITNTTNSTAPYIPDGMPVADENITIDNSTNQDNEQKEIDFSKIKIEVDKTTIDTKSISIKIINDNKDEISYGAEFKIQKNMSGQWRDLEYLPDTAWISLAYITKGNSQTDMKLDIENYYGELNNGNYRVVKKMYNGFGSEHSIYSDEFEIK